MEPLQNIELFRDLSENELQDVRAVASERQYGRGAYVFMEGETREAVFFVQRGLIKVFKVDPEGREHIVSVLGTGQMFPHMGFFNHAPYPGTAEVMSPTTLWSIGTNKFEDLLTSHPVLVRKMIAIMGQKIGQLQDKLQELALFDAHERVAALVHHFAEEHGVVAKDGIHIHLPITNGEMGRMIGMSRESVSRIWNEFRREGILTGDKEDWILDKDWLDRGI